MVNVVILSELDAIEFVNKYKDSHEVLLVSIADENEYVQFYENEFIKIVRVFFGDVVSDKSSLKLMTLDDAKIIKREVDSYINNGGQTIVVHCKAGISRSGAVGIVISEYVNKTSKELWESGSFCPNIHCYKIMCNVFGVTFDSDEFDRNVELSAARCDERLALMGIDVKRMFLD